MKEFLAGFQVDTENKALAGICAGLGNYFNIQANIVRLVTALVVSLFYRDWDYNSNSLCLSSRLAWE